MKLTREAIQRMISQKQGTSNVTVINQEGGGGGGGVTLGPLLTSLNAEAMPSAEGYLHWTGSAWAFDTPTGGDPVDLTPYALKTWVQTNYASKDDIADFITKDEADTYYAALNHTHANYLPLSAGPNKALTGSLYFSGNSGINWSGGVGMLACTPESGWTGISSSQWGVGALSAQGVIRSNANDLLHYRNNTNYKIWDAYNFTPSDYLPLTGGTVQSLTVTNGLDADSITVSSLVNSDTLAEYLDQDASDARYLQLTGGTLTGNLVMNGNGIALVPNLIYPNIYYQNGQIVILGPAVHVQSDGVFLFNGDQVATQPWVTAQLGSYLPLTGGTVNGNLNVKGTIQAQDSSGNNKVIIYGTTGNIRAEKVYIGGSTSGYEAATHNWVTSQGYQANVIETVKVSGTALTPTNKAVDIPAATSDGSTFGVVAIGTGFSFDEDRLCVDTSTFATRTWADGRYLPLTAGSSKPLTGDLWLNGNLVAGNPNNTTNDDSAKIAFYTNKNYPNISPYIQAIYENNYGRKRLSVFQKNVADWDTPQVEVFTIKPNGNVGIGTTSPAYKLDVSGVIKATEGVMVRDANGNRVGLGIDGLLMMYPSSGSSASAYVMSFEYDASGSWPMVKTKFSARPQVITGQSGSTYTYTNVALTSDLSGYATQQWVGQQGYITQTTADGRYLPLTAGSSKPLTGDLYLSEDLVLNNEKYIYFKNHSGTLCDALSHSYNEEDGIDTLYLGFDFRKSSHSTEIYGNKLTLLTGASARERLVITSGGNVGIGTTSPAYLLDVNGNARVNGYLYFASGNSNKGTIFAAANENTLNISADNINLNTDSTGWVNINGKPINTTLFRGTGQDDDYKLTRLIMPMTTPDEFGQSYLDLSSYMPLSGDSIKTGKLAVGTTAFDGSNAKLQVGGNMFATGSITSKSNAGNVSLGNGNISATNLYISTVVFGTSNNDPAIYIGNGHVYARNSQGQTTMIV